ncbi:hypothetical protein [Deinococcus sp. YIM 77859]|uniref:hypothetical protein n=1 Tax=Deinococcus sp. YIM 77859 TaxID=1540221 RepID=UPI00054EEF52|nr:hypothetical protein [Deinococcus sp. YIM 77859]
MTHSNMAKGVKTSAKTAKTNDTLLLLAGGLLAAVAVGAVVLSRRPTGDGAGVPTETGGSFWDKVPEFSVHNGLGFNGYGSLFDRWVNGVLPGQNPLPPRGEFGYYGPSFSEQWAAKYGSESAAPSSPAGSSGGFTPAGSSSGTGGFGVSAGRYY